jgi:hypothetical protein
MCHYLWKMQTKRKLSNLMDYYNQESDVTYSSIKIWRGHESMVIESNVRQRGD